MTVGQGDTAGAPTDPFRGGTRPRTGFAGPLAAVVAIGALVNLLMLTGPIYMLQVYDRVLASRSEETLVALSALATALFVAMGVLDHTRGRIAARISARIHDRLDAATLPVALAQDDRPRDTAARHAPDDIEAIQRLVASPAAMAMCDLAWTPMFVAAIFVFHPLLGWIAVAGAAVLLALALMTDATMRGGGTFTRGALGIPERLTDPFLAAGEGFQGGAVRANALARWAERRRAMLYDTVLRGDTSGALQVTSRTFRLFLQSAILGAGAWLVLDGALTAGAIIAASLLLGRALAPIDVLVSQWPLVARARAGWRRLRRLHADHKAAMLPLPLPRPRAHLVAAGLAMATPDGTIVLRDVTFRVMPGEAMGVIGPSGAGKSTLARALCGDWRPVAGALRLDGATLDQFGPQARARHIGYMPQHVTLFDGTIAQNIAQGAAVPDPAAVVAAAQKADAHAMILRLPQGYDTQVHGPGGMLSGGQVQRIGLARALYGDPVIVVLDEPNAHLDSDGSLALNTAIRALKAEGRAVIIMAHRPTAIQECDTLLVLDRGTGGTFGARAAVLREVVRNHAQILHPTDRAAGA